MRLIRRAALLAAFYLLTTAVTASAECAWVLWEKFHMMQADGKVIKDQMEPIFAFEAAPPCMQSANERLDSFKERLGFYRDGSSIFKSIPQGPVVSYHYMCLPDTVDPRGPKGK